jgi:hypothetical protein
MEMDESIDHANGLCQTHLAPEMLIVVPDAASESTTLGGGGGAGTSSSMSLNPLTSHDAENVARQKETGRR